MTLLPQLMIGMQISLGFDNPKRIVYHAALKMYGVACVREEPVRLGEPELITSSFRILDDTSFSRKKRTSIFLNEYRAQDLPAIRRIRSV